MHVHETYAKTMHGTAGFFLAACQKVTVGFGRLRQDNRQAASVGSGRVPEYKGWFRQGAGG